MLVSRIMTQLRGTGKWCMNVFGGSMQTDGVSDIVTHDKDNVLTLIEVKMGRNTPSRNQFNQGLSAIHSGNRFIVAYEDFNIFVMDDNQIPVMTITEDMTSFDLHEIYNIHHTVEIQLEKD